jgi:hypothetical protein
MTAWLVWVPGPRHPCPQVAFDEVDAATGRRAIAIHVLEAEDEDRARGGCSLDELARSYPPPEDPGGQSLGLRGY